MTTTVTCLAVNDDFLTPFPVVAGSSDQISTVTGLLWAVAAAGATGVSVTRAYNSSGFGTAPRSSSIVPLGKVLV